MPAPGTAPQSAAPAWNADALFAQIENFIQGALTLDPEQAAIRGGLSLLVLLAAALVLTLLRIALRAAVRCVLPEEEKKDGAVKKEHRNVGRISLNLARFIVTIAAIVTILEIWGFNFASLTQGAFGEVLSRLGRAALVLVLAMAAIEVARFAIIRGLARIARRSRDMRRAAQLRTLGPVLAGLAQTILIIIAASMVLSEVGVEIGPLLAGAGIAGLAIGFGAQTLVKDFLTGIFLIVEDIVSIGDIVTIDNFGGVVEEMTLRTIRLRDFDGSLHVFPYGEAQVIHNKTKTFSYYAFDLSVSYSSDIGKALEIMRRVGDEMQAEPEFGAHFLAPIEVVGVDALADSAVILKGRIKTAPGKQWTIGREYLKRIKLAFDAADIEIPFPQLKIVAPDRPIPVSDTDTQQAPG